MNHAATTHSAQRLPLPPRPRPDWAWFLDVDGTLLHLTSQPEHSRADPDLLNLISDIHRRSGGACALISGRSLADIDRIFHYHRFPAAGQHGAETRSGTGETSFSHPQASRWSAVRQQLKETAARHPGLAVEDKGLSLALHYRQAPGLASFAHQFMHLLQQELGAEYLVQRGKRVVELKPAGTDKGLAIASFMRQPPFAGRIPVFLGDDVTDEYGFDKVNALGGLAIKVGPGQTRAGFRLPGVDAALQWLGQLVSAGRVTCHE